MMYGFGDDQNPYTESVDLLEDLVIEFITEMTHRAMEIGRTGRVQVEDIVFLGTVNVNVHQNISVFLLLSYTAWHSFILLANFQVISHNILRNRNLTSQKFSFTVRKDPRKYARVKDLLTMNEELKKARKAFDEVKYAGTVNQ